MKRADGYITLVSVLIVGAVGIAMTIALLLFGIGSSRSSYATQQSVQAWSATNACIEEGLQQVRDATAYTGTGSLNVGVGSCVYTVTSQGGSSRSIYATGTVGTIQRKSRVTITAISPFVIVGSWQEIAD